MKTIEEELKELNKNQLYALACDFAQLEIAYRVAWDNFNHLTGCGLEEATGGAWETVYPMCMEIIKEKE